MVFVFWLRGFFHTLGAWERHRFNGGAVAVCFEGLLREGRLKVARGRSWQPEIGMEHASRGRRSGNKGVGARWRGRFRIFSARHCSRTKVSHTENSGMTMLFFSWGLLRCRRGILSHAREWMAPRPAAGQARRGLVFVFLWRLLRCRRGILSHAREWAARGLRRFEGGCKLKVSWSFPPTPSLRRRPPLSKTPGCVRRASPGKDTCRRAQSPR